MDFRVFVQDFKDTEPSRDVLVHADDWYSAFLEGTEALELSVSLNNLNFTMLPDGLSAKVTDPNRACWYWVKVDAVRSEEKVNDAFALHVLSLTGKRAPTVVTVLAGDWFSALQEGLAALGESSAMEHVSVVMLEDDRSAKVVDPNSERCFLVHVLPQEERGNALHHQTDKTSYELLVASGLDFSNDILALAKPQEKEDVDLSVVTISQRVASWTWRYGWLWFLLFVLGVAPAGWISSKLQLAWIPTWTLAFGAGLVVSGWAWSVGASRLVLGEFLSQSYWKYHELLRGAGVVGALLMVWGILYVALTFGPGLSVWGRTFVLFIGFVFLLVGFFRLSTGLLLWLQVNSNLSPGLFSRWILRIATFLTFTGVSVGAILVVFIGGMHWWHANYVTPKVRNVVMARHQSLSSLQLKSLEDRKGRSLGLYQRTRSDWATEFNSPELLKWPISQAIMLSEGRVQKPAWWWRYLPDGHRLMSEPFSVEGFLRIPYYFLRQRRKVGGSTPTLQAAKNFVDFGASRKGKGWFSTARTKLLEEIPRSYVMSQILPPREMLATYMATMWIGHGDNYGLHRMGLYFFGVRYPSQLTWNQAAVLASSFPNPGSMNPWSLQSCLKGKCSSRRRARAFKVWTKRIWLLKRKLRRRGIVVSKKLPEFYNGLGQLRVLSRKWMAHDIHLRKWLRPSIKSLGSAWKKATTVQMSYDRLLTLGPKMKLVKLPTKKAEPCAPGSKQPCRVSTKPTSQPKRAAKANQKRKRRRRKKARPQGLVGVLAKYEQEYRKYLSNVQITYSMVDSRDGGVVSQYGGALHFDMARALKPVVGSTFKVLTLLVAEDWPDRLPLLNRGRGKTLKERNRRRFLYQQVAGKGDFVRNSHGMPPFVSKRSALTMSANIGFVFLSLRWTWMVSDLQKWSQIMRIGLTQLYQDRLNLTQKQAHLEVQRALASPSLLYKDLNTRLGYSTYLRGLRKSAALEAAKAKTVQTLLKRRVSPRALSMLLGADSAKGFPRIIRNHFFANYGHFAGKFRGDVTLETLSWLRPLRMELGLRYLIHIAKLVAGYKGKRENLQPVMTTTLGVNNASTLNLARIGAVVARGDGLNITWVRSLWRGDEQLFDASRQAIKGLPLSSKVLQSTKLAMNGVLRWGTAGRAGNYVLRRFGNKVLRQSGAKTGTVQDSRGVSCIGFLEHRAGAVTISTPNNLRLKRYFLRSWVTKPLERAKVSLVLAEKRLKAAKSDKAKERAQRRVDRVKLRLEKVQKRIEDAEGLAKSFLKMGKIWKRSLRKAGIHQQRAARRVSQAQFVLRQMGVYRRYSAGENRMIRRYQLWFERFHKSAQDRITRTQKALKETQKKVKNAEVRLKKSKKSKGVASRQFTVLRETHNQTIRTYRATLKKARKRWRKKGKDKTLRRYRSMYQLPEVKLALRQMRKASKSRRKAARAVLRKVRALQRAQYWAKVHTNNLKRAKRRAYLARTWEQRKPLSYRRNVKRLANNRSRLARWKTLIQDNEAKRRVLFQQRDEQLVLSRKWVAQSEREKRNYKRIEAKVGRTHRTWKLNSSQACMILFKLLGYWKQYEAKSTK